MNMHKHIGSKAGCKLCGVHVYSKVAVRWVESEAQRRRLKGVLHAENGGEYRIPGTRFFVDGYHPRSRTIFEFYGDAYHGNPSKYRPRERPHPFDKSKTAKHLYVETVKREALLNSLGYNVISIWESDYRLQTHN